MVHCKTALSNLTTSDELQQADNSYKAFSDGVQNFLRHYCLDDHTSTWCHHDKVKIIIIIILVHN